jgi:hypothetical protein
MVSDVAAAHNTPVKINQDANLYVSEVTPGSSSSITIAAGRSILFPPHSSPSFCPYIRQAYFLLVEGDGHLTLVNKDQQEESELNQHDAAELFGPCTLTLTPSTCSSSSSSSSAPSVHALLIEMTETGPGRRDI